MITRLPYPGNRCAKCLKDLHLLMPEHFNPYHFMKCENKKRFNMLLLTKWDPRFLMKMKCSLSSTLETSSPFQSSSFFRWSEEETCYILLAFVLCNKIVQQDWTNKNLANILKEVRRDYGNCSYIIAFSNVCYTVYKPDHSGLHDRFPALKFEVSRYFVTDTPDAYSYWYVH